jgi:LPXTG cell wall anchor motif
VRKVSTLAACLIAAFLGTAAAVIPHTADASPKPPCLTEHPSAPIDNEENCLVTPKAPTVTQPTCDAEGSLTIPESEGVKYKLALMKISAGVHPVDPGKYQVVAVAKMGYKITPGAESSWDLTVNPAPANCTPDNPDDTAQGCEAYFYTGTNQNLCTQFPGEQSGLDCNDVKYRVTLVDKTNDPWGLDGNLGTPGVGCEENPLLPEPPSTDNSDTGSGSASSSDGGGTPVSNEKDGELPFTGDATKTIALIAGSLLLAGSGALGGLQLYRRFH